MKWRLHLKFKAQNKQVHRDHMDTLTEIQSTQSYSNVKLLILAETTH